MLGIGKEIIVFAVAVCSGANVRLAYRCLSCFREIVKHSLLIMGIEDLIFWIGTALYIFVQIYQTSSGSIRWYFVLGVVSGAVLMTVFIRKIEKTEKILLEKTIAKRKKKR